MRTDGGPFEFYKFKKHAHDFWRCYSCHRIFTYEQERARVILMEHDASAAMCSCRSLRYKPTRPSGIEWIRPNVLTYTLKLVLARGLGPWLEEKMPAALPYLESLVAPTLEA